MLKHSSINSSRLQLISDEVLKMTAVNTFSSYENMTLKIERKSYIDLLQVFVNPQRPTQM